MSHAEKCPVCQGSGKYFSSVNPNSTAVPMPGVCHGCAGKGWVEVEDKVTYTQPITYLPYPGVWWSSTSTQDK